MNGSEREPMDTSPHTSEEQQLYERPESAAEPSEVDIQRHGNMYMPIGQMPNSGPSNAPPGQMFTGYAQHTSPRPVQEQHEYEMSPEHFEPSSFPVVQGKGNQTYSDSQNILPMSQISHELSLTPPPPGFKRQFLSGNIPVTVMHDPYFGIPILAVDPQFIDRNPQLMQSVQSQRFGQTLQSIPNTVAMSLPFQDGQENMLTETLHGTQRRKHQVSEVHHPPDRIPDFNLDSQTSNQGHQMSDMSSQLQDTRLGQRPSSQNQYSGSQHQSLIAQQSPMIQQQSPAVSQQSPLMSEHAQQQGVQNGFDSSSHQHVPQDGQQTDITDRSRSTVSSEYSKSENYYSEKFILELPKESKEDTVINYIEVVADCDVKKVEFSSDGTSAVISVDPEPDWKVMAENMKLRTLERKVLSYSRLAIADSICILNVSDGNEKGKIIEYFQSSRSGNNKKVPVVDFAIKDNMAVVTFKHTSAVDDVLSQGSHKLDGRNLDISIYYKDIGAVYESSKILRDETLELLTGEARLMGVTEFLEAMRKEVPMLKEAKIHEDVLLLKGTEKGLCDARDRISEFKDNVLQNTVDCSRLKMDYLSSEHGGEYMVRLLRRKGICVAWVCGDRKLQIFASSERDLDQMKKYIEKNLKTSFYPVTCNIANMKSRLEALKGTLQEDFDAGSFELTLDISNKQVQLVAQHEQFDAILEIVTSSVEPKQAPPVSKASETFVERGNISSPKVTKTETIPKDKQRFIQRYKKAELRTIQSKYGIQIRFEENSSYTEIYGEVDAVAKTLKYLQNIIQVLTMVILPLDYKISGFLVKSGYLNCLKRHIEGNERCVVSHKLVETPDQNPPGAVGGVGVKVKSSEMGRGFEGDGHSYGRGRGVGRGLGQGYGYGKTAPNNQNVHHGQGEQSDWQVKTSRKNRRFKHDQKMKIVLKDGEIAMEKVDVIVNTVTSSFDLQAGPVSKSIAKAGGSKLKAELEHNKYKLHEGGYVVTQGGNLHCKHVFHCCLPYSGSYKAGECVGNLMSMMLKHADSELSVETIAIPALGTGGLMYDPGVVANTMYSSVKDYSERNPSSKIKEVRFVIYKNEKVMRAFADVEKQVAPSEHDQSGGTSTRSGLCPKLVVAEIAMQQVDVIVNPSNSLLLSNGAVSKSLIQYGGDSIQKECDKIKKRIWSLLNWHFEVTSGGKLKCRKIYHCAMPSYNPYSANQIKDLQRMVGDMLAMAQTYKSNSIAFPALGTGNLGYPRKVVADTLYKAVGEFWKRNKTTTLKDVRFVIYPADTESIQAFKDAERAFRGTSCSGSGAYGHHASGPQTTSPLQSRPQVPPRSTELSVCSMKVKVKQGDITEENLEAIVNPINPDMSLTYGSVSKAIQKIGGPSFEKDTKHMESRLKDERVACVLMNNGVSVIHVDRHFIKASQTQAILHCVKYADRLDMKTVGFPILKKGNEAEAEEMAVDLHAALNQLYRSSKHVAIQEVHVIIYQPGQYSKFAAKLKQLSKESPSPSEDLDEASSESQHQITFTLLSDTTKTVQQAKQTLQQLCSDKGDVIETAVRLPPTISTDDISLIGMTHDDKVMITMKSQTANKSEILMKGKPHDILCVIKAFQDQFETKFEEWQSCVNEDIDSDLLFDMDESSGSSPTMKNVDKEATITEQPIIYFHSGNSQKNSERQTMDYETGIGRGNKLKLSSSNSVDLKQKPEYNRSQKPAQQTWDAEHARTKDLDDARKTGSLDFNQQRAGRDTSSEGAGNTDVEDAKSRKRSPYRMKWFFLDPETDDLQSYGDISRDIEDSYVQGKQEHKLPEDEETSDEFLIDFKTMEEYPVKDPTDKVAVLRQEDLYVDRSLDLPKIWDQMGDEAVKVVALKQSDKGFEGVKESVAKTCGNLDVTVLKVERVQNQRMFYRYLAKKKTIEGEDGGTKDTQKQLWYRCAATDSIVPINNFGMSLHFCRQNNQENLCEGVSLAEAFENIVQRDVDGPQYAYLCKVLVGSYTKGKVGLRDPPERPACDGTFFHSVVDNISDPSTYVIFSDAQVYPEYLVTYKLNAG